MVPTSGGLLISTAVAARRTCGAEVNEGKGRATYTNGGGAGAGGGEAAGESRPPFPCPWRRICARSPRTGVNGLHVGAGELPGVPHHVGVAAVLEQDLVVLEVLYLGDGGLALGAVPGHSTFCEGDCSSGGGRRRAGRGVIGWAEGQVTGRPACKPSSAHPRSQNAGKDGPPGPRTLPSPGPSRTVPHDSHAKGARRLAFAQLREPHAVRVQLRGAHQATDDKIPVLQGAQQGRARQGKAGEGRNREHTGMCRLCVLPRVHHKGPTLPPTDAQLEGWWVQPSRGSGGRGTRRFKWRTNTGMMEGVDATRQRHGRDWAYHCGCLSAEGLLA
jgi:hypothetical protein